jgi:hypothetical protein
MKLGLEPEVDIYLTMEPKDHPYFALDSKDDSCPQ